MPSFRKTSTPEVRDKVEDQKPADPAPAAPATPVPEEAPTTSVTEETATPVAEESPSPVIEEPPAHAPKPSKRANSDEDEIVSVIKPDLTQDDENEKDPPKAPAKKPATKPAVVQEDDDEEEEEVPQRPKKRRVPVAISDEEQTLLDRLLEPKVLIIIGLVVAFIFYQRHQSAQMQLMLRIKELELQQAQL